MKNFTSIHPCCFSLTACLPFLVLISTLKGFSQPTNISGTVNSYAFVTDVDTANNSLIMESPGAASAFTLNDLVLIYQTQGAAMNQTNTASFGTITDVRGAGSFEFARVCAVTGAEIVMESKLTQTYYDSTAAKFRIQLVKVASYTDARITGTLTADPWNGKTGGVIALSVIDSLYIDGTIDASEIGFRGGEQIWNTGSNCNFFTDATAYFYPTAIAAELAGAKKGEGIAAYVAGREYGRGSQANGGGGGNEHNAGGGGGSNYGAGGIGGERDAPGFFDCSGEWPGFGGKALSGFGYSLANQRAFFGGGGGAGSDNNNQSGSGGNGGGLVIILANVITGTGSIEANGGTVTDFGSDGNGGGGGAGSILLNANIVDGATLTINANGGDGGDTKINCEGPGGGGAGGVIWSSTPLGGAATNVASGTAGVAQACANDPQGATSGSIGQVITSGLAPPLGIDPFPCVLSNSIQLRGAVQQEYPFLFWQSGASDVSNWQVESSIQDIWQIVGSASGRSQTFQVPDRLQQRTRFRVRAIYPDGRTELSNEVELAPGEESAFSVESSYRSESEVVLYASGLIPRTTTKIEVVDLTGRVISSEQFMTETTIFTYSIPTSKFATGWYIAKVSQLGKVSVARFLIRD